MRHSLERAFFLLSFSLPLPLYLSLSLSLFLRLPFLVLFICLFLFPLLFLFLCLSLSLSLSLQPTKVIKCKTPKVSTQGSARENAVEPKVPESAGTLLRDRPERAPRARDQAVFRPSRGNETRSGGVLRTCLFPLPHVQCAFPPFLFFSCHELPYHGSSNSSRCVSSPGCAPKEPFPIESALVLLQVHEGDDDTRSPLESPRSQGMCES